MSKAGVISALLGGTAALAADDAEASFIGTLAKTFPHDMHGMAIKMKEFGLSRDEIWRKTGIDLDNADGLPRSELPDNPEGITKYGVDDVRAYGRRTQRTINDQPNLFAAYPDMGGMTTGYDVGSGYAGSYDPVNDSIEYNPEILNTVRDRKRGQWRDALVEINKTNAHEMQHAVQDREGFARGGNTREFALEKQYADDDIRGINDSLSQLVRDKDAAAQRGDSEAIRVIQDEYDTLMDLKLNYLVPQSQIDPLDSYRRLAGEAEARNVETRIAMTPQERRETPPWATLDVPESEHIVRMKGNASPEALAATAASAIAGMEINQAVQNYSARRESKRDYWASLRQQAVDLANSVGGFVENTAFPALDKPMQGYMGLAGAVGTLAAGGSLADAVQRGAMIARQPTDQTAYQYGGTVTDNLSPYVPDAVAAGAGALVNAGVLMGSPL